ASEVVTCTPAPKRAGMARASAAASAVPPSSRMRSGLPLAPDMADEGAGAVEDRDIDRSRAGERRERHLARPGGDARREARGGVRAERGGERQHLAGAAGIARRGD